MIDFRENIPVLLKLLIGKVHHVNILDQIEFEPSAFYIMDKSY